MTLYVAAGVWQKSVPDLVGEFRQFDALDLTLAPVIEQTQLDLARIGGESAEAVIDQSVQGTPE
jgi:hypothetical protein